MKPFIFLLLFVAFCSSISAQQKEDSLAKYYRTNIAIPDMPAFKALNTEFSNILRPSVSEPFSLVSSQFFDGKKMIIPTSFAMEISPSLLINYGSITTSKYNNLRILHTASVSIGTLRDSLNTSRVSVGGKITLIDKGNMATNADYTRIVIQELRQRAMARSELYDAFLNDYKLNEEALGNDSIKTLADAYVDSRLNQFALIPFDKRLDSLKQAFVKNHWNALRWDFAMAWQGESPDTLLQNVQFRAWSFWTTAAFPIFKNKGQLLFGGHYAYQYNHTNDSIPVFYNDNIMSLSTRSYLGTNRIKGFLEGQVQFKSHIHQWSGLLQSGIEYNIRDGFWIDANVGVWKDWSENTSRLISNFRMRYTIPQNFKLF